MFSTPQSLASLQSHAGVAEAGARGAHCSTAGPQQLRPAGRTLKDTQNWGRELPGSPLVGAGCEREENKGQSLRGWAARRDARNLPISQVIEKQGGQTCR